MSEPDTTFSSPVSRLPRKRNILSLLDANPNQIATKDLRDIQTRTNVTKTVGAMLGVDDGSPDDLTAFLNSGME